MADPAHTTLVASLGLKFIENSIVPQQRQAALLAVPGERVLADRCRASAVPLTYGDYRDALRDGGGSMCRLDGGLHCCENLVRERLVVRVEPELPSRVRRH